MDSPFHRANRLIFIALALQLVTTSVALALNFIQGYSPFSSIQIRLSNTPELYFAKKYQDGQQRIFLVITVSLIISQISVFFGLILSLSSIIKKSYIKSQWLLYNKFNLLYLSTSIGLLTLSIALGWQTTILIELLIPTQSNGAINIVSIVFAGIALGFSIFGLIFILRNQRLKQQLKKSSYEDQTHQKYPHNLRFKLDQIPKHIEKRLQSNKIVRKNVKSTKKKEVYVLKQLQPSQKMQIKETLLSQPKGNIKSQAFPNQLLNLSKKSLDLHEKQRLDVPQLIFDRVNENKQQGEAKNPLGSIDISIIPLQKDLEPPQLDISFIPQVKKQELCLQGNNSPPQSILSHIKLDRLTTQGLKSSRPDIRKMKQALKLQRNTLIPK